MGGFGQGMGSGQGQWPRPENESDSNFFESQVRGKVGRGKSVIKGTAEGPNQSGDVLADIQQSIQTGEFEVTDPVQESRIPRAHRDHARQYFDALREGEGGGSR